MKPINAGYFEVLGGFNWGWHSLDEDSNGSAKDRVDFSTNDVYSGIGFNGLVRVLNDDPKPKGVSFKVGLQVGFTSMPGGGGGTYRIISTSDLQKSGGGKVGGTEEFSMSYLHAGIPFLLQARPHKKFAFFIGLAPSVALGNADLNVDYLKPGNSTSSTYQNRNAKGFGIDFIVGFRVAFAKKTYAVFEFRNERYTFDGSAGYGSFSSNSAGFSTGVSFAF